jgi:hypothetical protein
MATHFLGLWVQMLLGAWMSVSFECCVLSWRSLCDGLIARPEESYQAWHVYLNVIEEPCRAGLGPVGLLSHEKKNKNLQYTLYTSMKFVAP